MPSAPRRRTPARDDGEAPEVTSRLMRIHPETYDLVAEWAEKERRHMNQQLAVIVEEWDRAERARQRESKRRVRTA